ncbi:MAG: glutaredoxin family protein [Acidobacteriota bacterium]
MMRLHRSTRRPAEIVLYAKPGCHLCEEMKEVIAAASRGLAVEIREVDVSADPELSLRYREQIPVLFINGRKAFKYRATEKALRRRLLNG